MPKTPFHTHSPPLICHFKPPNISLHIPNKDEILIKQGKIKDFAKQNNILLPLIYHAFMTINFSLL
ncbi:hypothetical protein HCCG_01662 [Helicobacter cinaedi CCUG 18818 = ATCC BAA-847]|uniref:Uncharacterized protein n=1 Tax=Helicobacter cinaedi CCUG 18818 = ATCC BAA-847 TaxID=537971 RepID=A0ABN0BBV8_9HELI|nr:hypothetical protein HCCG_01662 [Helicobacter cinaedi CCUG 18818 = ATCC BAA-847]